MLEALSLRIKVLVSWSLGPFGGSLSTRQNTSGDAQVEMKEEMVIRASNPLHQSVQKCPSSRVRTSDCVRVQSREMAEVVAWTMSKAVLLAKDPRCEKPTREQRLRQITPRAVMRKKCQRRRRGA